MAISIKLAGGKDCVCDTRFLFPNSAGDPATPEFPSSFNQICFTTRRCARGKLKKSAELPDHALNNSPSGNPDCSIWAPHAKQREIRFYPSDCPCIPSVFSAHSVFPEKSTKFTAKMSKLQKWPQQFAPTSQTEKPQLIKPAGQSGMRSRECKKCRILDLRTFFSLFFSFSLSLPIHAMQSGQLLPHTLTQPQNKPTLLLSINSFFFAMPRGVQLLWLRTLFLPQKRQVKKRHRIAVWSKIWIFFLPWRVLSGQEKTG